MGKYLKGLDITRVVCGICLAMMAWNIQRLYNRVDTIESNVVSIMVYLGVQPHTPMAAGQKAPLGPVSKESMESNSNKHTRTLGDITGLN